MTRRSERELKHEIDRLGGGSSLPLAGPITILSTEYNGGTVEPADDPELVYVNGDLHRIDTRAMLALEGGEQM